MVMVGCLLSTAVALSSLLSGGYAVHCGQVFGQPSNRRVASESTTRETQNAMVAARGFRCRIVLLLLRKLVVAVRVAVIAAPPSPPMTEKYVMSDDYKSSDDYKCSDDYKISDYRLSII